MYIDLITLCNRLLKKNIVRHKFSIVYTVRKNQIATSNIGIWEIRELLIILETDLVKINAFWEINNFLKYIHTQRK